MHVQADWAWVSWAVGREAEAVVVVVSLPLHPVLLRPAQQMRHFSLIAIEKEAGAASDQKIHARTNHEPACEASDDSRRAVAVSSGQSE